MSRANTFYASSADRERVHSVRMVEGEARTITLDLAALIPGGVTLTSVAWAQPDAGAVTLSGQATGSDTASVRLTATTSGTDTLTATATLSSGDRLVERFVVEVAAV